MHLISERILDDGIRQQHVTLNGVPGIVWRPPVDSAPTPLILHGQPGGLDQMLPRLMERVRRCAAHGLASATLELPGSGERPPLPDLERARSDLRQAMAAGRPVDEDVIDRLVLPLVDRAVPECRAALDDLLALPEFHGPVGYSGGNLSVGVRLAAVEPRIGAVGLFAGSLIPRAIVEDARRVVVPVHLLLQWDDRGNDRQAALDLFDALGSSEKTLSANMGGHMGVPAFAGEEEVRFLARHLR